MAKALWNGTGCYVNKTVAVCPECGGELTARSIEWDSETGQPAAYAIEIDCLNLIASHRYLQSDWQPIRDAISKWCDAYGY